MLAPAATFVVNLTTDENDASSTDGVCDVNLGAAGNQCTLRAAIQEANRTTALDNINFSIPRAGLQTITLVSGQLPTINNSVVIDGYTQPGASVNTLAVGNNAVFRIQIDANNYYAMDITAGSSTIRGLAIFRGALLGYSPPFDSALNLRTNGNNRIEGCWFGLNGNSSVVGNRRAIGIADGDDNLIGGLTPDSRNVISSSNNEGIIIRGGSNHLIQNNYIGTDPNGAQTVSSSGNSFLNFGGGIFAASNLSSNITIGGADANARNVISRNFSGGIILTSTSSTIRNNNIGVSADGTNVLDNSGGSGNNVSLFGDGNTVQSNNIGAATNSPTSNASGIGIFIQSSNNVVGGTNGLTAGDCTGDCNRIAFNSKGVVLDSGNTGNLLTNNRILGNSIYSNSTFGIDLDNDGLTANDGNDGDIGSNNAQNFPVLTSAASGSTRVRGTLNSTPNRTFRLEFFNNPSQDSTGYGEGQTFIGTIDVTTSASGSVTFSRLFADYTAPTGSYVSATATDLTTGDTSEFAQSVQVASGATAANVSVGGRVLTANGNGIRNVRVTMTDANGITRSTLSSAFGYYRFAEVLAGDFLHLQRVG